MRSTNIPYLGELDQLRGLAALWIAVYHCQWLLGHWMVFGRPFDMSNLAFVPETWNPLVIIVGQGHSAVALFMVLSGFIFSYGAFDRSITYNAFIQNRLLRIYPLFLALLAFGIFTASQPVSVAEIVQTALQLGTKDSFAQGFPFSAMFWTLAIECQFYLIFPLIFAAGSRRGYYRVPLLLIVALLILRLLAVGLGANARDISYYTIVGRLDQFLVGMVAGFTYAQRLIPESILRRAFLPTVLFTTGVICGYKLLLGGLANPAWWKVLQPPIEGTMWAAFMLTYLEAAKLLPKRIAQPLEWTGTISYSIYMLHVSVIWLIGTKGWYFRPGFGFFMDLTVNFVLLVLPALLLLSSITYHGIEEPFLRLRKRYVSEPVQRAGLGDKEVLVMKSEAHG